jgi:antitoxin MazE
VRIAVEDGRVAITPEAPAQLTLEQRLALYDASRHGGEIIAASAIGAEKW